MDFVKVNKGDGNDDDDQPVNDVFGNNPLCFVIWNP